MEDLDLVAGPERGPGSVPGPDLLPVHEDLDERPERVSLVPKPVAKTGITALQVVEEGSDAPGGRTHRTSGDELGQHGIQTDLDHGQPS
jgi:hypothetical protein